MAFYTFALAFALRLHCDSDSRLNKFSTILVSWLLLCVCVCVSDALSIRITFRTVRVVIENANESHMHASHMHSVPAVLRPVYGVGSLSTLKGACL